MSERPETLPVAEIAEAELTPLVRSLLRIIDQQQESIKRLEEEILKLKGGPGKPEIKPSRLEQRAGQGLSDGEAKGGGTGSLVAARDGARRRSRRSMRVRSSRLRGYQRGRASRVTNAMWFRI
jgi:hypothetical protein